MRYQIVVVIASFAVMIITGCCFHLRGSARMLSKMKIMTLNSYDPYGPLTRAIYAELLLNNITVADDTDAQRSTTLPSLRIINSSESHMTASIFQNGKTAEYKLMLTVQAHILMPGEDYCSIEVKVYHSFFDNSLAALAKNAEKDLIYHEMRQQAAQQIVRKLLLVHATKQIYNKKLSGNLQQQQLVTLPAQ